MTKIIVEHSEEDNISAFAFNTGVLIEKLIAEQTNNLKERCQLLEAKILQYSSMTLDPNFKLYFNITTTNNTER